MKKSITALFFIFSFISLNSFAQSKESVIDTLNAEEFSNMIAVPTDNSVILDVRTQEEFESGHISNALNIDFFNKDFKYLLSKLDKAKTYFVYCKVGIRSNKVCNFLNELGFTQIYHLNGGIDAWSSKEFLIVK